MQISQMKEHCDWLKNNIRTNQELQSGGRHLDKEAIAEIKSAFLQYIKGLSEPLHLHLHLASTTARAYDQLSSLTQNLDHT